MKDEMLPENISLRIYPDPILRKKSKAFVFPLPPGIKAVAESMLAIMYEKEGIGLAGPQAGISRRIIVYDLSEDRNEPGVMINPVILSSSGKSEREEGCLSFPGVRAIVKRSEKLEVKGFDCSGAELLIKAEGLLSIMFQHEIDHLEGITFVDRLSPTERLSVREEIKELERLA